MRDDKWRSVELVEQRDDLHELEIRCKWDSRVPLWAWSVCDREGDGPPITFGTSDFRDEARLAAEESARYVLASRGRPFDSASRMILPTQTEPDQQKGDSAGITPRAAPLITQPDLLDAWEKHMRGQGRADSTLYNYLYSFRLLEKQTGKPFTTDLQQQLDPFDVWEWLDETAMTYSAPTRRCALAAIKGWVKWGHARGLWDLNGIVSIPTPPLESEMQPPLEPDQAAWLLDAAELPDEKRVVMLGLFAGTRISETARIGEHEWLEDRLRFVGSKTRAVREVPIAPELAAAREGILSVSPSRRQARWAFEKLQQRSPFHWTTHGLRRTFAQRLLDEEVPVTVVEALLGHGVKSTTLRSYAQVPWKQKVGAIEHLSYPLTATRAAPE